MGGWRMKSKYNRKKLSHRPFLAAAPAAAMLMLSIATDVFMIGAGLLPRLLLLAPTLIFGIRITAAQENPEYKIPWLLLSVALPITAIIS